MSSSVASKKVVGSDTAGITVVVPCFNESESIDRLREKLENLIAEATKQSPGRPWYFLFIDDGSSDSTHQRLDETFGNWGTARILQHSENRGLMAAMQTGFTHCTTEWVAVIDSDCTYDPLILVDLLHAAERQDFDVVTASPYHRLGGVENVPGWRIQLSKTASWLYRWPMRSKLSCYTCCVRVYKRKWVQNCPVRSSGFVGVTELLWRLDRAGARIGEFPARLFPRVTGVSKMRTARTTLKHFSLLSSIMLDCLRRK